MTQNKVGEASRMRLPDRPVTLDDIEVAYEESSDEERLELARELVLAAETPGRLVEAMAEPYALSIAAEIHHDAGDLDAALECAEKAVAANERINGSWHFARAQLARLLFAVDRDEEALGQLKPLRRRMNWDPDAVTYVTEALEDAGRSETAMRWLTGALMRVLDRPNIDVGSRRAAHAYLIAAARRRLRLALDQPADEYDEFADRMTDRIDSIFEEELRPSRNAPCHCGSGLKYKRCHGRAEA